jgi:hypothetical protein
MGELWQEGALCFFLFEKSITLAFMHVDANAHSGRGSFATKAMMWCYLGQFARWTQMAFSLL